MKQQIARAAGRLAERQVDGWLGEGLEATWQRFAGGITAWVRAGRRDDLDGWKAALGPLFRLAVLGGLGYIVWSLVRRWPWLLWLLLAAALGAAWKATHKRPAEDVVEDTENTPAEQSPEERRAAAEQAFVDYVVASIGEAKGVHLSTLAEGLDRPGYLPGWGVPEVRAQLGALNIPCRRSVKVRDAAGKWAVAWGVHRDDVPALNTPSPVEDDEAAA
ncbi:hypothetical protein DMA15_12605 [Streptomyces sp. WAC 01529]|uniref:hypothetical protein n=1 Tax=Streptomyces sp. WAC 01529 TaxID=2203205 RepID=UPI000F6DB2C3|nr:hypothetical protein [Streptomyces sp. WAC 01529]AZM53323.1 hypothetical protein DMA15_12605 [Streptomyces sp. WAC 01529]